MNLLSTVRHLTGDKLPASFAEFQIYGSCNCGRQMKCGRTERREILNSIKSRPHQRQCRQKRRHRRQKPRHCRRNRQQSGNIVAKNTMLPVLATLSPVSATLSPFLATLSLVWTGLKGGSKLDPNLLPVSVDFALRVHPRSDCNRSDCPRPTPITPSVHRNSLRTAELVRPKSRPDITFRHRLRIQYLYFQNFAKNSVPHCSGVHRITFSLLRGTG